MRLDFLRHLSIDDNDGAEDINAKAMRFFIARD